MLEFVKNKMRDFLGIETKSSGSYSLNLFPEWGRFEKVKEGDYASMVRSNKDYVYACINCLAFNVSKVPFYIYKHTAKEDVLIPEHPFYNLLKNPNENMLPNVLLYLLQAFLDATGNAYLYHPLTPVNRPGALYILESHLVNQRIEKGVFLYDYNHGGQMKTFTGAEVLHFMYPNMANKYSGLGPIEAGRMGINLNEYMSQYQLSLLANRARPDGVLKTDQDIGKKERRRAGKEWMKQYGGVDKAGRVAVLGKGLDYEVIALSPKDLAFVESKNMTIKDICVMFGVPLYKLGIVEDVNRANAEALEHSFQKDTIGPRLYWRDAYFTKLVQLYDPRLIVKSDNVVPRDKDYILKERELNLKTGVWVINDVKKQIGEDEVSYGRLPYLPFNLMQVGSAPSEKPEKVYVDTKNIKQWKEQYWKVYVRKTINEERLMIAKLRLYFDEQMKIVLRNIRKYGKGYKTDVSFFLFAMSEWNDKLAKIMKPLVQASVLSGGESLIEDFGLDVTFDITSPFVSDFFSMREMKIKHINRDTFDKLTKSLTEGIQDGETIKELSARVETVYSDAKGYRSRMIARTETNIANNFGHMESMRLAGIERKEWVTAGDEDVRFEHDLNGDQGCIDFNSEFYGTNEQYPGEINCRCVVIPCLEE